MGESLEVLGCDFDETFVGDFKERGGRRSCFFARRK